MTHTEAFAFYGTEATNIRYCWTAINEQKKRAVITAWQDGFTNINGKPMYHRLHADPRQIGHNGKYHGYRELVEHIALCAKALQW